MIRFERRLHRGWAASLAPFASVMIALVVVAVMVSLSGNQPLATFALIFNAAFTNPGAFTATLLTATPLVFTGLCVAVAYPLKAYNIGGEGQLYIGALAAAAAGIALGGRGGAIAIPAMILAGAAGGLSWSAVPAVLRAYFHTSEILTSLMLNYVAALLCYYLIFDSHSYWRDLSTPSAQLFPQGKVIADPAFWPGLNLGWAVVPLGFLLSILGAAALAAALHFTRFGFRVGVISGSEKAGRYAGMHTRRTLIAVMLLSGAFAGLAGASQVGDFTHFFDPKALQQGTYGYTGIVAAALGRLNPIALIPSAIFLGAMTNAGFTLQGVSFPLGLVGTMEGTILFCLLSAEVLSRYRIVIRLSRRHTPGGELSGEEPGPSATANPTSVKEGSASS